MKASAFKGINELKGSIKTKIRLSVHVKNVEYSRVSGAFRGIVHIPKSCKSCKSDCVAIVE